MDKNEYVNDFKYDWCLSEMLEEVFYYLKQKKEIDDNNYVIKQSDKGKEYYENQLCDKNDLIEISPIKNPEKNKESDCVDKTLERINGIHIQLTPINDMRRASQITNFDVDDLNIKNKNLEEKFEFSCKDENNEKE